MYTFFYLYFGSFVCMYMYKNIHLQIYMVFDGKISFIHFNVTVRNIYNTFSQYNLFDIITLVFK